MATDLSLDDASKTLTLVSKDDTRYVVERNHALVSKLVAESISTDVHADELPIPGVAAGILQHIVRYMEHHKGKEPELVEKPLRSKLMKDVCKDAWDAEFIDKIGADRQQLYDVILAANYMDIPALLHLGCAKVASLIKGQPLDKIKDILSTGAECKTACV